MPCILLGVWGLSIAPASHFGVIVPSCMLCFSTLGGWWILGDKPGFKRRLGLGAILIGVALVGWEGLQAGAPGSWRGDLVFVFGGFMWASYTIASRVWQVSALQATILVSVISMALYMPFYLISGVGNMAAASMTEVLAQGVFQGVLASIVGLLAFTRSVVILGAGKGATFGVLVPPIALILGIPVLGESKQAYNRSQDTLEDT